MKKLLLACFMLPVLATNAQTVKKVMLEDFTGIWCQFCPNGAHTIEGLETQYPATFIPVASHNDGGHGAAADVLEIPEGLAVATGIGVTGYPTGAVDRKMITGGKVPIGINATGDQWKSAVASELATTAIASVSFRNMTLTTAGAYEGDLVVKFDALPTAGVPVVVNVYVLESKIPATTTDNTDQTNVTQWYGGNGSTPISTTTVSSGNKFYHDNTLRASLGGNWGFSGVVPATPVVGTEYIKHFSFTIPATAIPVPWIPANMDVVGFVAYNGADALKKEVINAERVTAKSFFPAGVNQVKNNVNINTMYPNPATTADVVNVEFNIVNSSKVTVKVMNAIGQVVATPYISNDVAGAHTVRFSPSYYGMAAGIYTVLVSTVDGTFTQQLNIQ